MARAVPHTEDLALALACASGDPAALATFEREVLPRAVRRAAHMSRSSSFGPEVAQALRIRLFVADGRAARILAYDGSTPLAAWAGVIARHCALNLLRASLGTDQHSGEALERYLQPNTPELAFVGERLRGEFRKALSTAIASLEIRERSVLRLHFAEHLPLEGIAKAFGVHRSSVARWLATGRANVLERTRLALASALGQNEQEIDSMLRAARSNLELSLISVFGIRAEEARPTA